MAEQLASLVLEMSANSARLRADLERVRRDVHRMDNRFKQASTSIAGSLARIASAAAVLKIGKEFVKAADTYTLLQGRLKLVTASTEELKAVEEKLFAIAQKTRSGYEETAELYTRVARSSKVLELSQQEILNLTTLVNQAIQVSGATSSEAAAGVVQFSQAMSLGVLRGQDLKSVMSFMPRVAQAIVDGLNTLNPELRLTIGDLLKMGEAGELGTKLISRALATQAHVIDKEFSQLPRTVGQAMTQLGNDVQRAMAQADMSQLIEGIEDIRDLVKDPEFVRGLVEFGNGLAFIAKWALKSASALGMISSSEFAKLMRSWASMRATTMPFADLAATGDVEAFQMRIVKLRETIDGMVARGAQTPESQARIDGLRQEILTLERLRQLYARRGQASGATVDLNAKPPAAPEKPVIDEAAAKAAEARAKSIQSIIDSLKEEQATLGQNAAVLVAYKLKVLGASDAQIKFAAALAASNESDTLIHALKEELATLGKTAPELAEYQQRLLGVSEARVQEAGAIARAIEARKADIEAVEAQTRANEELIASLRGVIEGLWTEEEALRTTFARRAIIVEQALERGLIDEAKYIAIIGKLHDKESEELKKLIEGNQTELSKFVETAAENLQNVMADTFFNWMQGNFANLGAQFKQMLDRMVANALAAQLGDALFGKGFGKDTSEIGGWLGGLLDKFGGKKGGNAGVTDSVEGVAINTAATTAAAALTAGGTSTAAALTAGATSAASLLTTGGTAVSTGLTVGGTAITTAGTAAGGALTAAGAAVAAQMVAGATQAAAILSAGGGGGGGGGGAGLIASLLPGRVHGGPVTKGQPYIVGEKRAELFVPDVSGRIIPRVHSGGDNGNSVVVNINIAGVKDARGVREAAANVAARAGSSVQMALARNA